MTTIPKDTNAAPVTGSLDAASNIAVVGGGIGGLVAAYWLAKAGARVTVYEASDKLGGLGTFFQYRNVSLERFYHCMLPSDRHLLGVLRELGDRDDATGACQQACLVDAARHLPAQFGPALERGAERELLQQRARAMTG